MAVFQWGGSIQFGPFISIPVRAKAAVKTESLSLNMLHKGCGGAMGYKQDWGCANGADCPTATVDPETGEIVNHLTRSDSQKGWKGNFVDEEYLKSLKAERSKVIEIDGLVPADQIDPRYYEASYDVTPEEGGEKAYVLFLRLLERSGKVAIGKAVLSDRENIVTIRPRDGVLAMEVMYWPEDLTRAGRDLLARERIANVTVTEQELSIGDQLVAMMSKDFDPTQYRNAYAERVLEYLKSVEDGTAAPAPVETATPKPQGMDLLAALQASLGAAKVEA